MSKSTILITLVAFLILLLIAISSYSDTDSATANAEESYAYYMTNEADLAKDDSDGDGYFDRTESATGSDPKNINSTPIDLDGDGVPNRIDYFPDDPGKWEKEDLKFYFIGSYLVIFLLLVLLVFMIYTRITQLNALEHDTRSDVYKFIQSNPGVHSGEISQRLNINKNTLRYHLKNLLYTGHVRVVREGKFKYFYTTDYIAPLFLTPIQKEIVAQLRQNGSLTTRELAARVGKARQTMHYHINKLRTKNLLKYEKLFNNKTYWYLNYEVMDLYVF